MPAYFTFLSLLSGRVNTRSDLILFYQIISFWMIDGKLKNSQTQATNTAQSLLYIFQQATG